MLMAAKIQYFRTLVDCGYPKQWIRGRPLYVLRHMSVCASTRERTCTTTECSCHLQARQIPDFLTDSPERGKALFTRGSASEPLAHIHGRGWWLALYEFQCYLFSPFSSLRIA